MYNPRMYSHFDFESLKLLQYKAVSETATSATATARSRASAYSSTLVDALV